MANAFEIKSASLDLLAILLRTDNLNELSQALEARFGVSADIPSEAFMLDLEALPSPEAIDYEQLLSMLSRHGVRIVALRSANTDLVDIARQYGLAYACTPVPVRVQPSMPESSKAPLEPVLMSSRVIERPVRAGQQIYAKGCDLVVLSMVSAGAEIIADGSIHVYAPLRGRALAGARGNTAARIFTRSMEAELVSIAGVYRTIEQALPASILGKPAQVYLENERLVMTALLE
ncbi:septum site-determining protein MinC [Neisseriaceae bacterium TC5R-5]|nr:septum site-determining protein MinC [Neisseriaceae bacterium TC5R-5]